MYSLFYIVFCIFNICILLLSVASKFYLYVRQNPFDLVYISTYLRPLQIQGNKLINLKPEQYCTLAFSLHICRIKTGGPKFI